MPSQKKLDALKAGLTGEGAFTFDGMCQDQCNRTPAVNPATDICTLTDPATTVGCFGVGGACTLNSQCCTLYCDAGAGNTCQLKPNTTACCDASECASGYCDSAPGPPVCTGTCIAQP